MKTIVLILLTATIQTATAQLTDSLSYLRKPVFYSLNNKKLSSYHPFGHSTTKPVTNNNFTKPLAANPLPISLNWNPGDPKFIKDPYKAYYEGSWILGAAQLFVPGMQRYNTNPPPEYNRRR